MIRNLPVAPDRLALIATGHVNPVQEWVETSDGRRAPSGNQAREKREDGSLGLPVWEVSVLPTDTDRPEIIAVQVAGQDEPKVAAYQPVQLDNLTVRVTVGRDGKLRGYWSATGASPAKGAHQQHQHKQEHAA